MIHNILTSHQYLSDLRTYISETERKRGQWNKATAYYADFLLDSYIEICKWYADQNEAIPALSLDTVLNGASGWHQYSYGGCALVYNGDIAKVVFTPAQFAKWEQGRKVTAEPLLDIQARALAAGWRVLKSAQRYADMCTNLQNRQPNFDNIEQIERAAIRNSRNGEPFVLRGRKYRLVPDPEGVSQTRICDVIVPSERTMNPREGPNQPAPA